MICYFFTYASSEAPVIQLIPVNIEHVELKHRPWIHVTGVVKNSSKDTSSFDIDAAQYTSALKSDRENSVLPVHVLIRDSPKYKNGKPVPSNNNTYVAVTGFISRFDVETERLIVDLDSVTFLGRPTIPAESKSPVKIFFALLTFIRVTAPTTPVVGANSKTQKLKFNFDDITSPTPLKRRREDLDLNTNAFNAPSSSPL